LYPIFETSAKSNAPLVKPRVAANDASRAASCQMLSKTQVTGLVVAVTSSRKAVGSGSS
jgi:hypothetical protein